MKTPVIIAAYNEERLIGKCLDSLHDGVEPIVITNGCEDATAEIAKSFGVRVIERQERGKLPAIQAGLRELGSRALDPVLYLDADSYPSRSRSWERIMLGAVRDQDIPAGASGPLAYFDRGILSDALRSIKRSIDIRRLHREGEVMFRGANSITRFDAETLDAVLDLPHIWPGDDLIIERELKRAGGLVSQVTSPRATVVTSARSMLPLLHIASVGREVAEQEILQDYWDRAAPDSIRFRDYLKSSEEASSPQD